MATRIRIPILKGDQIDKLTALVKKFNQSKDLRKELILRIQNYFLMKLHDVTGIMRWLVWWGQLNRKIKLIMKLI